MNFIEPGNEMYNTVIIFVEDCTYFRQTKLNMISARNITGVASHGKHTRATEHVTPCMLTMTLLPERMLVRVHYLALNRLRRVLCLNFCSETSQFISNFDVAWSSLKNKTLKIFPFKKFVANFFCAPKQQQQKREAVHDEW